MFLVKGKESRSFDVFFVFKNGGKHVEKLGKEQSKKKKKNDPFPGLKGAWGFL